MQTIAFYINSFNLKQKTFTPLNHGRFVNEPFCTYGYTNTFTELNGRKFKIIYKNDDVQKNIHRDLRLTASAFYVVNSLFGSSLFNT